MREDQGFSTVGEDIKKEDKSVQEPVRTEPPTHIEIEEPSQVTLTEAEQESQPIVEDFTFNPVQATALKKFFVLVMTIIIVGGSAYGGYQYYLSIQKDKPSNDIEETTTTEVYTTKADAKPLISKVSEMKTDVKDNNSNTYFNSNLKGYEEIRLSYPENCTEFDKDLTHTMDNGVKLNYQCTKYKEDGEDQIEIIGKAEEKHDFNIKMINICGAHEFFASKDGFMDISHGCVGSWISLKYTYKDTTKDIHNILFQTTYNGTPMIVPPIVDGYNVYYVTTESKIDSYEEQYKSQYCNLNELNIKTNTSKLIEQFECNYVDEE